MNNQRVLVFRIGQLGDTIIALPAFWAVREHFASAHLALLSDQHPKSSYVFSKQLLPSQGLFDEYLSYEANANGSSFNGMWKILPKIRQRRFDVLVYLAPRIRTRRQIVRDLIFFRLAGISRIVGHHGIEPLPARSAGIPLPEVEHEADHLLRRLALAGIAVPAVGQAVMDLRLTESELAQAREWLNTRGGSGGSGSLIGIGPGGKYPSKLWPPERYEAIGRRLIQEFGVSPIVLGGPDEMQLGNQLVANWKCGTNAAGELSPRQSASVLHFCRLYVGNDNGTMHLAAAVGTLCVAIFSAQDWPGHWHPYGSRNIVLRSSVPCEGCKLPTCLRFDTMCLKQISVEKVLEACRTALNGMEFARDTLRETLSVR